MKKLNLFYTVVALVATMMLASCNPQQDNDGQQQEEVTAQEAVLSVDELLAQADSLSGQTVLVQGVCTHACSHGATKIFLMGTDDTQTIRVEAGDLGAFDKNCVHSFVKVKGTLVEDRIDEAYLQAWEAREKNGTQEQHGNGQSGCDSEKKARGESANTTQERIADFRAKITLRKQTVGKDFLSFYHIVATEYEYE